MPGRVAAGMTGMRWETLWQTGPCALHDSTRRMLLSALLTPIVVPPVNLLLLALLALWRRRHRAAAVLLAVLLRLAVPGIADGLTAALERGMPPLRLADAQAILVLGGDLDRDGNGTGVPGPLTLERLRDGAALARRTGLPVAVTGGPAWRGGPPIGTVMADSLRHDFGVPARWVETSSTDTWDNARDSEILLAPFGIRRVLVVTQAWHMRRSLLAFRHSGLVAIPAAVRRTGYPPSGGGTGLVGILLPRVSAWQRSYFALHEWIGIGWYWLRDLSWR